MNVVKPLLGLRGAKEYGYFECVFSLGPQQIGDTRDNLLTDFIGRIWRLLVKKDSRDLELAQQQHDGSWLTITTQLPPLFNAPLTADARHISFAFDQSARVILAFEEDGEVKLTRWDTALNQYVQNVTFVGIDPVVVFDATWAYDVTVSDVLIFYLDAATREKLMCRVQRDLYAIEYELWDYEQPVVLDRVTRLPLRYQVLASDEDGDPLEDAGERIGLLSDLYPYPALTLSLIAAAWSGDGDFVNIMINAAGADDIDIAASMSGTGVLGEPILEAVVEPTEIDIGASMTGVAVLGEAVIDVDAEDELDIEASTDGSGVFANVMLNATGEHSISIGATMTGAGTYG